MLCEVVSATTGGEHASDTHITEGRLKGQTAVLRPSDHIIVPRIHLEKNTRL